MTLKLFYFNDNVHKDKEGPMSAFNITFFMCNYVKQEFKRGNPILMLSYMIILKISLPDLAKNSKTTKNCDIETCQLVNRP